MKRSLKWVRVGVAAVVFALVTLFFLGLGGGFGLPVNSGSNVSVAVLVNGVAVTNRLLEDIRANTGKKGSAWL